MPSGPFPERFLKCIAKEDRAPLGKAGETIDEATARAAVKLEREMHQTFKSWCNVNHIFPVTSAFGKKSHLVCGTPDFVVIFGGKAVCVEFKLPGKHLSEDQQSVRMIISMSGTPYVVAFSAEEAIKFTVKHFNL